MKYITAVITFYIAFVLAHRTFHVLPMTCATNKTHQNLPITTDQHNLKLWPILIDDMKQMMSAAVVICSFREHAERQC